MVDGQTDYIYIEILKHLLNRKKLQKIDLIVSHRSFKGIYKTLEIQLTKKILKNIFRDITLRKLMKIKEYDFYKGSLPWVFKTL